MIRLVSCAMVFMSALVLSSGVSVSASAGEDCAEKAIRARAAELGGYEVWAVKAARPGVLAAFRKAGAEGVLMVGMVAVEPDLVTSQGVWGRSGGSALTADESAWLGRLFEKLYGDAAFMSCGELARKQAPPAEDTFAAIQEWWNDLNGVTYAPEATDVRSVFLWVAVAFAFSLVVVVLVVVRVRRFRKNGGIAAGAAATGGEAASESEPVNAAEPRSETPGEEPVQPDEPEDVL